MITKPPSTDPLPSDPRQRAGAKAEQQMAFYLNRAFAEDPQVHILNDLRIVDPNQPEHDGRPGVCQIDHLALHRWGAFVIESKSVSEEVSVRSDGSGGDEWTRKVKGKNQGFPSPVQQAHRQAKFLRRFLSDRREQLLGKMPVGLRTITKVISGAEHRGFGNMPLQIIIAISDNGKINRVNRWKEPTEPFRTFVCKADNVSDKIAEELTTHRRSASLLSEGKGAYGIWQMKPHEVAAIAEFLASEHTPREASPRPVAAAQAQSSHQSPPQTSAQTSAATNASPACKSCNGTSLTAHWGKYGYYWKCNDCDTNTAMPTVCSICGAEGQRGQTVRIRKEGANYFRVCESCGKQEKIWIEQPN